MAVKKRRRKKKINRTKLALCALLEAIVIMTLVVIVGWDYGVEDVLLSLTKPVVKHVDIAGINSQYGVLMQANGGRVIWEQNGEEQMYPASLTKVMTTIVALEELESLDQRITLSNRVFEQLQGQNATQAGFQAGEDVRALDLLYGAMLPSGAECCLGLAEYIAGSEAKFVELMNKKANALGMDDTNFENVTGLHSAEHYSTAKDMAILMKYAIRNKTFRKITESSRHSTGITNVHPEGITYYSTIFKNLTDAQVTGGKILGGKTGYTGEAGLCLASYAVIEDREYILVTAGAWGEAGEALHIQDAVTVYNQLGAAAQALLSENEKY